MRLPDLPSDVAEWLRSAFASCSYATAARLSTMPTTHEEALDMAFIDRMASYSAPIQFPSQWIVQVRAYYEGGRRHYRSWEIADIGLIVLFRRPGAEPIRKLALLQSKRIYPLETKAPSLDLESWRYELLQEVQDEGGGLAVEAPRVFEVTPESKYLALQKADAQFAAIRRYEKDTRVPVHYLLYNPLEIPMSVEIPASQPIKIPARATVGARVIPSSVMRSLMHRYRKGRSPSYAELVAKAKPPFHNPTATGGWRLEDFIVDLVLRCEQGYRAAGPDDLSLIRVVSLRAAPIAAAVSITFDVAGEGPFEQ